MPAVGPDIAACVAVAADRYTFSPAANANCHQRLAGRDHRHVWVAVGGQLVGSGGGAPENSCWRRRRSVCSEEHPTGSDVGDKSTMMRKQLGCCWMIKRDSVWWWWTSVAA